MCDDKTRALLYARAAQIQEELAAKRRKKDPAASQGENAASQLSDAGAHGPEPVSASAPEPKVTASKGGHRRPSVKQRPPSTPPNPQHQANTVRCTRSATGSTASARTRLLSLVGNNQPHHSQPHPQAHPQPQFSAPLGFYRLPQSGPAFAAHQRDFTLPDNEFLKLKHDRYIRSQRPNTQDSTDASSHVAETDSITLTQCVKLPVPKDARQVVFAAEGEDALVVTAKGLFSLGRSVQHPLVRSEGGSSVSVAPDGRHLWVGGGDESSAYCMLVRLDDNMTSCGVHWFLKRELTALCAQAGTSAIAATAEGKQTHVTMLTWSAPNLPFETAPLPVPEGTANVTSLACVRPGNSLLVGMAGGTALVWDLNSRELLRQVRLQAKVRDTVVDCIGAFCGSEQSSWPCFLVLRGQKQASVLAILGPGEGAREAVAFSMPSGAASAITTCGSIGSDSVVVCGTDTGALFLWSLSATACVAQLCDYPASARIRSVAVHPTRPLVAALSDAGVVHIYTITPSET